MFSFSRPSILLSLCIAIKAVEPDLKQDCSNSPDVCFPKFICDNKTFTCNCPEDQFLGSYGFCVGFIGNSCATIGGPECEINAFCNNASICECDTRYLPSEDLKSCRLKIHGEICQLDGDCQDNLQCSNSTCACEASHPVPSPDGASCRKNWFGETCLNNETCSETLVCSSNGKCGCKENMNQTYVDKGYRLYETKSGKPLSLSFGTDANYFDIPDKVCVSKVGGPCSYGRRKEKVYCVRHAYCEYDSNYCDCTTGFFGADDGLCYAKFGTKCDEDVPCKKGLVCYKGVCACPNKEYDIYDTYAEICRGVPGSLCGTGKGGCVNGAACKNGSCFCQPGYVQLQDFSCGKVGGFESRCDYENAEPHMFASCDEQQGLSCIERKCQCENSVDTFDTVRQRCVRPIGFPCRKSGECAENSDCSFRKGDKVGVCYNAKSTNASDVPKV